MKVEFVEKDKMYIKFGSIDEGTVFFNEADGRLYIKITPIYIHRENSAYSNHYVNAISLNNGGSLSCRDDCDVVLVDASVEYCFSS